ncbi:MAG: type II toxin-antitoxin system VapC family toxin [Gammaproteobacteria bacterium]
MSILIDTDVIIDHLRGILAAREWLLERVSADAPPAISVITVAEIEAGIRASERRHVEALLRGLHILPLDNDIAVQGGRYRALYGRSHGVLLPDVLIAATARIHKKPLYTLNDKHYPMDDIRIVVPYRKP